MSSALKKILEAPPPPNYVAGLGRGYAFFYITNNSLLIMHR